MTRWVTADHHFDHRNIIKYANRPYDSLDEMHVALIRNWNDRVQANDVVYVVGDFCFGSYAWPLDHLQGEIHLIAGNHDGKRVRNDSRWRTSVDYREIIYRNTKVIFCHYPFETWRSSGHGSVHIHGHCHGKMAPKTNRWDAGVDCWGYAPKELDYFVERRSNRVPYQHDSTRLDMKGNNL